MLGHVYRQGAPAAARLDDRLTGSQLELSTDVVKLRHLGIGQRCARMIIVSACINHALIQPQFVKVVAEIVMVINIMP